jgi:hypothetical protein
MALNNWVNDELHRLLGYSDFATVKYMISQAEKSTDPDDFIQRLQNIGTFDHIDDNIKGFASKLLDKVPHAGSKFLTYKLIIPSFSWIIINYLSKTRRQTKRTLTT